MIPDVSAEVVDLKTRDGLVGDGTIIEPDAVLEGAKGAFLQVVVLGYTTDGEIRVRCSHGSRDALWAIERAKLHLMLETE